MALAARLPLAAWRNEVCVRTIRIVGLDLTDWAAAGKVRAQVRLRPDTPGAALIDLATVTTAAAEGIKLESVAITDGVPTSTLALRINKTTMEALPYSGEIGDDSRFFWALQLNGVTRNLAEFWALANVMDSGDAPANRPASYGSAMRAPPPWAASTLTFADQTISVSIDGADILSSIASEARGYRDDTAAERQAAESSAQSSATSAGFAEEFAGPAYETVEAGEGATAEGYFFRVRMGTTPETYTRYQRTATGSVVAAPLASTAELASQGGAAIVKHMLATPGAVLYSLADLASQFVLPAQFGITGNGDETAKIQDAINYGALAGREVRLGGFTRLNVTGLTCPGGTNINLGETELFLMDGSNQPILRTAQDAFHGNRPTKKVRIVGRTPLNCNATGQDERGADGVWLAGVRFTGVDGLEFKIGVRGSKRFAIWLTNVTDFVVESEIFHDSGDPVHNKDGLHINGDSSNGRYHVIVHNGNDDAVALNADDNAPENDFGAPFTTEAISGPISDVSGYLLGINCLQGIRLLAAQNNIIGGTHVIRGGYSNYAFNFAPYGLGDGGRYEGVEIDADAEHYALDTLESSFGIILIPPTEQAYTKPSTIRLKQVVRRVRAEGVSSGENRYTMRIDAARAHIRVDYLEEQNAANPVGIYCGANFASKTESLRIDKWVRSGERVSADYLIQVAERRTIDTLSIGSVTLSLPIEKAAVQISGGQGAFVRNLSLGDMRPDLFDPAAAPVELASANGGQINLPECSPAYLSAPTYVVTGAQGDAPEVFPPRAKGTTAQRPPYVEAGYVYADTTLAKPVVKGIDGAWREVAQGGAV